MKKLTDFVFDREGNAVVGAEVYVRDQGDNTLVDLFSDDGVTPATNPCVTDNDGEFSFCTADNTLKLQVYVDAVQQNEINQLQHFDLDNISAFIWTLLDDASAAATLTTLGVSAYAQTLLDDANAGAALTTLGVSAFAQAILDDADAGAVRTTLGTGTGDSPQFTAINLGHASDTTISRASAGVVAIEGANIITTAGGTLTGPLAVPDDAYDATTWNGSVNVPTKNAVRDKFEALVSSGGTVLIEEYSGDGTTGTKTFSSIPQTYRTLKLVWVVRSSASATNTTMDVQFNADTGANYDRQYQSASGAVATGNESLGATSASLANVAADTASAGAIGGGEATIPDYTGTTFHKVANSLFTYKIGTSSGNVFTRQLSIHWRSTAAISSITMALGSGNYMTGSKIRLYGVN